MHITFGSVKFHTDVRLVTEDFSIKTHEVNLNQVSRIQQPIRYLREVV